MKVDSPKAHLIFDFDGTLADSFEVAITAYNQVTEIWWLFGRFKPVNLKELPVLQEYSYQQLLDKFQVPKIALPLLFALVMLKYANLAKQVKPIAEIIPTLEALKKQGHHLHLVTSNNLKNVEVFLDNYKFPKLEIIKTKVPMFAKGKVLTSVLKELDITADQAVYIGDEVRDIQAGKQAGMKTIGVTWGFSGKHQLEKVKPDWLINKPKDLLNVLN